MRVLVTGATGFIGRAVARALLDRGDSVTGLTRSIPTNGLPAELSGVRWVRWQPDADGEWQREIAEHEAVVHLAGENAVGQRFTEARKQKILSSRVESTRRIVRGIELAPRKPEVLVHASGVGFYGPHSAEDRLDERAPAGADFLALVCVAWEAAARQAEAAGTRVVSARIGFVLGRGGGALGKLVPIFKAFAGGPLGNGRQMLSWIHLADVVGAFLKAIDDRSISGPMNVTGPTPVSNAELSRKLGDALGRPSLLPAPAFALRALYGEGADPLLTGQAALPRVLIDHGYRHQFTDLDAAFRDLLQDA